MHTLRCSCHRGRLRVFYLYCLFTVYLAEYWFSVCGSIILRFMVDEHFTASEGSYNNECIKYGPLNRRPYNGSRLYCKELCSMYWSPFFHFLTLIWKVSLSLSLYLGSPLKGLGRREGSAALCFRKHWLASWINQQSAQKLAEVTYFLTHVYFVALN